VPVISFNLVNFLAGLTAISWSRFLLATGVGILPVLVIMVLFGHYIEYMTWPWWLLFGIAAVLWWFVFRGRLQGFRVPGQGADEPLKFTKDIDRPDGSQ